MKAQCAKNQYDAIVIGGGHNGLVHAAYLAKSGLKVAVFERQKMVGGCAISEETWSGYKVSSLSYVNSLFHPDIIKELNLKKHGFEMLPRVPSSFTPFPNKKYLFLGSDKKKNQKEISKFSKKDAENYPKYEAYLTEISEVLEPIMTMIPPNPGKMRFSEILKYASFAFRNRGRLRKSWAEITRLMTGSASDFLDHWFESEELKITLATDAVIGVNASPKTPGTAYILFHHIMGEYEGVRGIWSYIRGGMGELTQSIAKSCLELGVDIFTDSVVDKILIEKNTAVGIEVLGKTIKARSVVSGVDPNITFNHLISEKNLPKDFLSDIRRISYDSASVKVNLALNELPDFLAYPGKELGPQHKGTIHLCPSFDYLEEAYADSCLGRPSRKPILECTIPSSIDDTVAPSGKHIMNIFCQYGPYKLRDDLSWDSQREIFLQRVIDVLCEYAPNMKDAICYKEIITPLDLEQKYHLTGGNIFHGRMSLDQIFHMRPAPGYADYRTPVKRLYMCASGTHPGGGVMGVCGLNSSKAVIKDLH